MWQRGLIAALIFVLSLVGLKYTFPYLAPLYLGALLALLVDGPVSYGEAKGLHRSLTALVLICFVFLGLPIIFLTFLFQLWQEVQALVGLKWTEALTEQVIFFFDNFSGYIGPLGSLNFSGLLEFFVRWLTLIPDLFLLWFLANFIAYFLCKDKRRLGRMFIRYLPKTYRGNALRIYQDTTAAFWKLVRLQMFLVAASSAYSVLVFTLLQLPYAGLLGILVGIFDLIPIVGPGLIYLAIAVVQIRLGKFSAALALGLTYLVLLLVRQFGEPHLVGEHLGLHPVIAVLTLYAGFRLWGLMGALIAPLLLMLIQTAISVFARTNQP